MLSFLDLVIAAMAVWRVSHMLSKERGPWDVFIRIREKLGNGMLGNLMDCPWCSSVWIAPFAFIPGTKFLVIVLSVSTMSIILEVTIELLRTRNAPEESPKQGHDRDKIHRRASNI